MSQEPIHCPSCGAANYGVDPKGFCCVSCEEIQEVEASEFTAFASCYLGERIQITTSSGARVDGVLRGEDVIGRVRLTEVFFNGSRYPGAWIQKSIIRSARPLGKACASPKGRNSK